MHIVGFGSTQWSSLNRIVQAVFLEIEFQNIFGDRTHERRTDREMVNYSMMMNDVSSAILDMDRVSSFACIFDGFISSDFRIVVIPILLDSNT